MPAWIVREDGDGVLIAVKVVPRARKSEVAGPQGNALRVRVAAPPVEGAANEALVAFLAETLGLRRRDVAVEAGERAHFKLVRIQGLDADAVAARLWPGS